jgi:hypothetical protein
MDWLDPLVVGMAVRSLIGDVVVTDAERIPVCPHGAFGGGMLGRSGWRHPPGTGFSNDRS